MSIPTFFSVISEAAKVSKQSLPNILFDPVEMQLFTISAI
jgi:hypothetical protein